MLCTVLDDELISHGPKKIAPSDQDYGALKPCFAWLPVEIIKKTFSETTQYARLPFNTILRKQCKSPHPTLNIWQCNEPVATDTIQSDTPPIDGGEMYVQIFLARKP